VFLFVTMTRREPMTNTLPMIIQGGMGIAVSDWRLANAVSRRGQLGVVSGTAIDGVLVRRLQRGDSGGHVRRALEAFPVPEIAARVLDKYFVEGGIAADQPFKRGPMPRERQSSLGEDLLVLANFVEVFLAKEGHGSPVGINFLEKIQVPTLASIFGAILGGVDYVLMGAGIPRAIPRVMDELSVGMPSSLRFDVKGASGATPEVVFDPARYLTGGSELTRPDFLGIVSSHVLATMLARLDSPADGFIVEGDTAGGHNAPPRGKPTFTDDGQPIYSDRDRANLEAMRDLGLPFWLAGGQASPEALARALSEGAAGIQVGTAFAFCEESGLDPDLKRRSIEQTLSGEASVFTDPVASPTGFPFKVITTSEPEPERERVCDLGYLRVAYQRDDESIGWRCPSEPVDQYVRKGGAIEDTEGRKCLCNALMSNIGLGQVRDDDRIEPPIITAGDDLDSIRRFLPDGATSYTAADVINGLLTPQV
jgi:NAD(P)H-dependent flavin oxidoreductase YrpB (nitropropane dioxygenase family)